MNAPFLSLAVAVSVLSLASLVAHAQTTGSNIDAAQIAKQGAAGNVPACVSCHGANGEGKSEGNFPRLAGLPRAYIVNQLTAYKDGRRNNPAMMPIVRGLTRQQMEALAAYYAELTAPAAKPAGTAPAQVSQRAQQLATVGDNRLGIQACANCHGPGGIGEPPTYPYLAGQHAGYLTAALGEWKSGARKTDPSMQMNMISQRLGDNDIAELAAYYAAQMPPGPESSRNIMPSGSAARPAKGPAGGGAQPAQPRAGVEQGEPTTGGSQGPGGGGGTGTNAPGKPKGTP